MVGGALTPVALEPKIRRSNVIKERPVEELLPLLEAIPTEAADTAFVVGIVGLGIFILGIAGLVIGMSRRDEGVPESVSDGFEDSFSGQQKAKTYKMIGGGVICTGLLVMVFGFFSASSPEGEVAGEAKSAKSALQDGDLQSVVDAMDSACAAVECHEDQPNVIVKPEIRDAVAKAHIRALIERAKELHGAGKAAEALKLSERAYELDSSSDTVAALEELQRARAEQLEKAGKLDEAAKVFEEASAMDDATRLYKKLGKHEDLCRLYPNIPKFVEAGEACLASDNTALAGYYFVQGGEPLRAADAYLKSGRKQEGINLLLGAEKRLEAAQAYRTWAEEGGERAADRYLAAAGIYEELENLEESVAHKRLAAESYASLADETQSKTQRLAAWQLFTDLEDSEAAAKQMELAIAKAAEFKSVGGLMELVRLNGDLGAGITMVQSWADDALRRNEPHEAAQYLSLLLSNLMGGDPESSLSDEEFAQMQRAMPGLLATNSRIAEKVAEYPEIKLEAFAVSTTYPDSGLQIHNHTTIRGQITNPHDHAIAAISLRVILFEPRFDTKELQIEGWRKIMAERGISEVEARKEWDKQTSEREKELYDAPVGFKTDLPLGAIGPGETIEIDKKVDSDVSYTFIDYYFVGMKKGQP